MEFKEIVKERHATKNFDERMVPDEKMHELLDFIRLSASSYNMQPWKIKVVKDQKTKESLLSASYSQPQITSCSHLLVFCADTNLTEKLHKITELMKKEHVPEKNVEGYKGMVEGMLSSMSKEVQLTWAQKQVYLALGNALNGAKALGLDSCPMEGFSPTDYAKILNLPHHLVPTVICPVGYAIKDSNKHPKLRFSKEEVFF